MKDFLSFFLFYFYFFFWAFLLILSPSTLVEQEKPISRFIDERDAPMEDVTTEDLGDGTSTIRPKEDRRDEKTQIQNIFPSQKAPEESQKATKVEEPASKGAQVITDDDEVVADERPKSVPTKNEPAEPKKEPAQQKEEPKKKQPEGSEEPESDMSEEVLVSLPSEPL